MQPWRSKPKGRCYPQIWSRRFDGQGLATEVTRRWRLRVGKWLQKTLWVSLLSGVDSVWRWTLPLSNWLEVIVVRARSSWKWSWKEIGDDESVANGGEGGADDKRQRKRGEKGG
ncbi:uncharacterized protein DS421_8g232200 [Arachis hypogaea]|nr:uncharacterized protein LOC112708348 [Arachis hypogaea]QHO30317.1 uncharacterized protein DS421_8g232200 [Arachis hypogaea]